MHNVFEMCDCLGAKVPPWLQRELIQSNDVDPSDVNEADCTSEHSDNDVDTPAAKIQINADLINADLLKPGTRWVLFEAK